MYLQRVLGTQSPERDGMPVEALSAQRGRVRSQFLALLLAACATACAHPAQWQPARPGIFSIDIETSGVGYPVYRIPALAVSNRGTLIAAYDGRPTMADLPGNLVVLVRRSVDGGRTWLPRQVARSGPAPLGFGDPSLLVDRVTGRIFLFYSATVRQGFWGSATGNDEDDPDVQQADVSWSDDDGLTWTHRRITASIKDPLWAGLFASSGQGIQLRQGDHAGRLIQQFVIRFDKAHYAASAFSDDHGATWHMGEPVGPGLDENKVVELSDGRVMLNSRAKPFRLVAWSSDGGISYNGLHPDSQLVDPANNGAVIRANPAARPGSPEARRLLISHTADSAERRNLVIQRSCDDGKTWNLARVIESGSAGYSTLISLPGGDVGLLYERGNHEHITFARFTPDWPAGC